MPVFVHGAVSMPDRSEVLRELRLLERRTSPSGKDTVDHPKNGSDDYANALCGCIAITLKEGADDHALISGGKLFSLDTGALLTDSSPWAPREAKPAVPAMELPPEALPGFDYKQQSFVGGLHCKLFGGGR